VGLSGMSLDEIITTIQAIPSIRLLDTNVNAHDMLVILLAIKEEIKRSCTCTHTK
jgi:hypothetical protein